MLLSGVYVVKDVIVSELLKRLQPEDLVAFGQTCRTARQLVRNSKAAKRAAYAVVNRCTNRKDSHKLHRKRMHPWTVLTKWCKGRRVEEEHYRVERLLLMKVAAVVHRSTNKFAHAECAKAQLRLYALGRTIISYEVDSAAGTVHCKYTGATENWHRGEELSVACTCGRLCTVRGEGQLANVILVRTKMFGSSGGTFRWWKL